LLAVRLPVSGAFHSPLMAQAGEEFGAAIAAVEIGSPKLLALCTTTCAPYVDIKRELTLGITRPVLWRGSLERLCGSGFRRFAETGPGKVLSKLARRTCGGRIEIVNVDDAP
jgi:malonyl CoA-acyl carrier protein transacylase